MVMWLKLLESGYLLRLKNDLGKGEYMKNIDDMIEEYIQLTISRGEALEEGNSKKANKQFDKIRKIEKELKLDSDLYVKYFEPLLEHENDYVKVNAAYSLLPLTTKKSEKVLAELSKKRGLMAFEAEMTLQEWKKGNLKF